MRTIIKLKILFCVLISSVGASIPTTEGLFRNGNNAEVNATLIMVKTMVTSKVSSMLMEKPVTEISASEEKDAMVEEPKPIHVKFLLSSENGDRVQLIQAIYETGKMNQGRLLDVRYFSNLEEKIKKSSTQLALFYSLLTSLTLNRSKELDTFLKLNSKTYRSNRDLVDPEKKALYERYKRYLKVIKEDESLKETMTNPMSPEDPEIAKSIELVKKKPFMQRDENVSLKKTANGFKWVIDLDVMNAVFDNKSHRLEKLSFGKVDKNINFNFDDYILFDGTHELPKKVKMLTPSEEVEVRITSLTHLNIGNKSMSTRYGEYRKDYQDSKSKDEEFNTFLIR